MLKQGLNTTIEHVVDCCYCSTKVLLKFDDSVPFSAVYGVCQKCGCFLNLDDQANPVEVHGDRFARLPMSVKVYLSQTHHNIFQQALADAYERNTADWRKYNTKIQAN